MDNTLTLGLLVQAPAQNNAIQICYKTATFWRVILDTLFLLILHKSKTGLVRMMKNFVLARSPAHSKSFDPLSSKIGTLVWAQ